MTHDLIDRTTYDWRIDGREVATRFPAGHGLPVVIDEASTPDDAAGILVALAGRLEIDATRLW